MSSKVETAETRAVVGKLYESVLSGNFEGVLAVLHDDLILHEPSFLPYGGTIRGIESFPELFKSVTEYLNVGRMTVGRIVAEGDMAVAFLEGETNAGDHIMLCEQSLIREGKIAEIRIYYSEAGSLIQQKPS